VTHTHAVKRLTPKEDALPVYLVKPVTANPYPLQGEDDPWWDFTIETVERAVTRYTREIPRPWAEYGWINYEVPNIAASVSVNAVFPQGVVENLPAAALTSFGTAAGRRVRLRAVARDGRANWRVVGRLRTYWQKTANGHQQGQVAEAAKPLAFGPTAGLRGETLPLDMLVMPDFTAANPMPDDYCAEEWNGILSLTSPEGEEIPPADAHHYIRIEAQWQDRPRVTYTAPNGKTYAIREQGLHTRYSQTKTAGSVEPILQSFEHIAGDDIWNDPEEPEEYDPENPDGPDDPEPPDPLARPATRINELPVDPRSSFAALTGIGTVPVGDPVTEQIVGADGSLTVIVTTTASNADRPPEQRRFFVECQQYTAVDTSLAAATVSERENHTKVTMEETPESAAANGATATLATPWQTMALTDPAFTTLITEGWCDVDISTPPPGDDA
jgi:hypothetical protein